MMGARLSREFEVRSQRSEVSVGRFLMLEKPTQFNAALTDMLRKFDLIGRCGRRTAALCFDHAIGRTSRNPRALRRCTRVATTDAFDPVLEVFKRDIDFTLVEKNLRLST